MLFEELISNYVIGQVKISDFPKIAMKGIEEGYESESLFILAGMKKDDNPFELKDYLELSLEELKIELKSKFEAAKHLTDYYINAIGKKIVSPINGVDFIKNNCWNILRLKKGGEEFEIYKNQIEEIIYSWYNYYEDYIPTEKTKAQCFLDIDKEIIEKIEKIQKNNIIEM